MKNAHTVILESMLDEIIRRYGFETRQTVDFAMLIEAAIVVPNEKLLKNILSIYTILIEN